MNIEEMRARQEIETILRADLAGVAEEDVEKVTGRLWGMMVDRERETCNACWINSL